MDLYVFSMCENNNLTYFDFSVDGSIIKKAVLTIPVPMYGCIRDEIMYIALREPYGEAQSGVTRVDLCDGFPKWTEWTTLPCEGRIACHITVSPDRRFLYTANYRSGSISEFALNREGKIVCLNNLLQFPKLSPDSVPHAHGVFFSNDGKELYAPDLGSDRVWIYSMQESGAIMQENCILLPPMSGPRHMAISRDGQSSYLICQNSSTIHSFRHIQGNWVETASVQTVSVSGIRNQSSAIRLSNDEKWIFASNRGADTVSMVRIDQDQLDLTWNEPCGSNPRDMDLSPDGKWLVLGNMDQNLVTVYELDYELGKMKKHMEIDFPSPVAVLFRR